MDRENRYGFGPLMKAASFWEGRLFFRTLCTVAISPEPTWSATIIGRAGLWQKHIFWRKYGIPRPTARKKSTPDT
jgi:hypothetical protein